MTEETEFDHDYMDEAICPHCGHDNGCDTDHDSMEYEEECGSCKLEYRVTLEYSVHFTTAKFDRAAEEAKRQKTREEHQTRRAERLAECARYPPGTRVRVKADGHNCDNRVGEVANRELATMVYINLDPLEGKKPRSLAHSFHANEVETE